MRNLPLSLRLLPSPAENILKSEANIGLLGQEDECECLSELFFMRAHGIIHDACGRAYCEMGVGKGYCYAVENPTIFIEIFSIPWAYFRDRVLHLESKEIAEKSLSKNFFC